MHQLVMPDLPAGGRLEANDALAIQAVARTMAAKIVVGRRGDREIHEAQFFIGAHRRPHIGVAGFFPGAVLPRLYAGLALLRHGVEGPEQLSAYDVEAAHVARRRRALPPPVHHRGADHDDVTHDHGGRAHGVVVALDGTAQASGKINPALVAERWHRLAGLRIERDHLRESGEHNDAFVIAVSPVRDAAMQPAIVGGKTKPVLVDFGIEHPSGLAGGSVDGGDLRKRGRGVERAADHQRRRFIGPRRADRRIRLLDRHVRRLPAPGNVQVLGVAAVDLRQRRITCRRISAGVGGPLATRQGGAGFGERAGNGLGSERDWCEQQRERHGESWRRFAHCRLPGVWVSIYEKSIAVKAVPTSPSFRDAPLGAGPE